MTKAAQISAGLLALVLAGFAAFYIFNPTGAAAANGAAPEGAYALTNMRVNGAAMLMLAVVSAIGAARQNWQFLVPAALYFLLVVLVRLLGLALDGVHPATLYGIALAGVLFGIAEFAVQAFRKAGAAA